MVEEILSIHEDLENFVRGGFLDRVWYFLKDIKNYELQIYIDPYPESMDEEIFSEYLSKYEYEDEYGTLIGRLNSDGFYDFEDKLIRIEIFKKEGNGKSRYIEKNVNRSLIQKRKDEYRKWLNYKPQISTVRFAGAKKIKLKKFNVINDLDYKYRHIKYNLNEELGYLPYQVEHNIAFFEVNDIDFFYKCNEAVFLLMHDYLNDINEEKYKYVEDLIKGLWTENYDCNLYFVGKCTIDVIPYREKILGADCDQIDYYLPSANHLYSQGLLREFHNHISKKESIRKIEQFIKSLLDDMKHFNIDIEIDKITGSDIKNLFPEIEESFKQIYRKNFDIIYGIYNDINPEILGKKTSDSFTKIFDSGIGFAPNGLNLITTLFYKILVPYWEKSNIPRNILRNLKKHHGSWKIIGDLRNFNTHDPNIGESFLINSLSLCMKCSKSLEEFENVLKEIYNSSN